MGSQDLILSLESLTLVFPLVVTLAALYAQSSVAFTSVAGASPDFDLAFQGVKPTIIIASAETMSQYHTRKIQGNQGFFQKLNHSRQASTVAAGTMRAANSLLNQEGPRLIYTSERAGADSVPLSTSELVDLRIMTGARIVYALTVPKVAGAVTQTNMMDYRIGDQNTKRSHFGAPLSCVDIKLVSTPGKLISDEEDTDPVGSIAVSGPAVAGGEVNTGIVGTFGDDYTLRLI